MNDKVALITGGAKRIGRAICEVLHENGYKVAIHCRTSLSEAHQLAEIFNAKRADSAWVIPADLRNVHDFPELINTLIQHWQRLDLLVNNASSFLPTVLGEVSEMEWDELMATNVKGPYFLSQAASPYLKVMQGAIINITDLHGQKPLSGYSVYSITKAGLLMMTQSLAIELAPSVRVNAVSPGAILWPEGVNVLTATQKQKIIDNSLLKKHGSPEDIAKAVLYFANAAFVTGQVLGVDGGRGMK